MPSTKQQRHNNPDRSNQLNTQWIAGVKDKEGLTAHLQNSGNTLVLVRLKEILRDRLNDTQAKQSTLGLYDTPSWPYVQAHTNGQIETLRWIVEDLLPFVTDRTTK